MRRRSELVVGSLITTWPCFAEAMYLLLAEARGLKRIFTLDSDFYVYRIGDREAFDVFPSG